MWWPNTSKENPLLEKYEFFLNYVEEVLEAQISDNVRNKNWNLFHTFCKLQDSPDLSRELGKKYELRGIYQWTVVDTVLRKRKRDIISWKQYMFPVIVEWEGEYFLNKIIFLEKKDTLWKFWEKVKDFVSDVFPWKAKET